MRLVIAAVVLLAACEFNIPPENGGPCTTSSDSCVCLQPQGVCVECTADDTRNCTTANEPVCGTDNRCRECRSNDECGDGACLEDGTCSSPSVVLYASPTGLGSPGCGTTPSQPCSIAQALIEVGGARSVIRLAPGTYSVMNLNGLDVAKPATLAALGATITRAGGTGPLVTVRPSQTLKLVGGTLRGLSASDGVKCDSGVLEVHRALIESLSESAIESNSCALTVQRSTLRDNLQGGINMLNLARVATIMNNFVYRNGELGSPVGGMVLKPAAGSRLEFNTVVSNRASTNAANSGGIACELNGYDAPRNLIYRNQGGLGGQVQVIGTCTFQGSYAMPAGTIDEDLIGFERPNDDLNPSFRLTAGSIAVNKVECRDEIDFEGDARPQPSGGMCDYGADELRGSQ